MSFTASVVTASRPHPKELSWIKSRLSVFFTYEAAAYRREWYIHWSITINGLSTLPRWATESSVRTAIPYELINSGIPWFISGSTWYGRPASTIPRFPVLLRKSITSSPFLCISSLDCISSSQACETADLICAAGISENSSMRRFSSISLFSNERNGFIKLMLHNLISSTLFLIFSAYEVTIGQL